ncbi:MAG: RlmE family RNA methyltransferase [Pseudomonadota bacterium]
MNYKVKDTYFKQAKKDNFVARSVYKLQEIDEKYDLIKKGTVVLDLGYYPGSWAQYASRKVGSLGHVYGVDIQGVNEKIRCENLTLFEGSVFELDSIMELRNIAFDLVISDMAPKTTGIKHVDQDRSYGLTESAIYIAIERLKENGNFCAKVFESAEVQELVKKLRENFNKASLIRPKGTRKGSKEIFLVGIGLRIKIKN